MRLTLFPAARVVGSVEERYAETDLVEALNERTVGFDAHVSAYVSSVGSCPRVRWDMLKAMSEKEDIVATGAFIDIDRVPHEPWPAGPLSTEASKALQASLEVARAFGIYPAGYTTRGGIRLVVPYETPVPLLQSDAACGAVTEILSLGFEIPGLKLDDKTEAQGTRFYRLPHAERDGVVLDSIVDMQDVRPYTLPPNLPERDAPDRVSEVPVVLPTDWPSTWPHQISQRTKAGAHLANLLAHKPLDYPIGSRNADLLGLVRSLSKQLAPIANDPSELAGAIYCLCAPSIAADTRAGSPTLDELRSMAARTATLDLDIILTDTPQPTPIPRPEPTLDDALSMEGDNDALVVSHPVQALYWIRTQANTWEGPYGSTQLATKFRDEHGDLAHTTSGGLPWAGPRLAFEYGVNAREVTYSHSPSRLVDERLNIQLYEGRTMPTPQRHPEVAEWVRLMELGCPAFGRWLSWADDLSKPLPALLLYGKKSMGKGMLGAALAVYFGGSYSEWSKVTDTNFGLAPLLRTPLVIADELSGFRNVAATTAFRSLVGNTMHTIEEKSIPQLTVHTATRFYANANTEAALAVLGRHTAADIDAIRARVLTCVPGDAPAAYLASLGGRAGTHDWVTREDGSPGKLVEHIAWLQTQRPAAFSGRWPVDPYIHPELDAGAARSNHEELSVWWAVAEAIAKGQHHIAWARDPGEILVSPRNLHQAWNSLVPGSVPMTGPEIAEVIRSVQTGASENVRLPGRRANGEPKQQKMRKIPASPVLVACDALTLDCSDAVTAACLTGNVVTINESQAKETT